MNSGPGGPVGKEESEVGNPQKLDKPEGESNGRKTTKRDGA